MSATFDEPIERLTFSGAPGEDVTEFLAAVKRVAITQGMHWENVWLISYAESCVRGDAMRWLSEFELTQPEDFQVWARVRQAFLARYPPSASLAPPAAPSPAFARLGPQSLYHSPDPPVPSTVVCSVSSTDKFTILGDSGVGKSSVLSRYTCSGWNPLVAPTTGIHYQIWQIDCNGSQCQDHYWDVSGVAEKSLALKYTRGVSMVWLVYDVTDRASFTNIRSWHHLLASGGTPQDWPEARQIFLIGNKSDLWDKRVVSKEDGQGLAKELGIRLFRETSAKTNEGFRELRSGWMPSLRCTKE